LDQLTLEKFEVYENYCGEEIIDKNNDDVRDHKLFVKQAERLLSHYDRRGSTQLLSKGTEKIVDKTENFKFLKSFAEMIQEFTSRLKIGGY
jgi:hypothetical protein